MKQFEHFPEQAGLYICQNKTDVLIVKITGVYPCLSVNRGFKLDTMITGSRLEEASKEELASIQLDSTDWKWSSIPIDFSVFPKSVFDLSPSIDKDEYITIRSRYIRLLNQGVGYSMILRSLVYKYNLRMDEARDLVNDFDQDIERMT